MTTEQEDRITDIMYNLPMEEIPAASAQLSLEARLILKEACRFMIARLERIAEQV